MRIAEDVEAMVHRHHHHLALLGQMAAFIDGKAARAA